MFPRRFTVCKLCKNELHQQLIVFLANYQNFNNAYLITCHNNTVSLLQKITLASIQHIKTCIALITSSFVDKVLFVLTIVHAEQVLLKQKKYIKLKRITSKNSACCLLGMLVLFVINMSYVITFVRKLIKCSSEHEIVKHVTKIEIYRELNQKQY